MFVGAADPDLCRARIAEQEIGERIARPLAVEREGAAGGVRVHRIERQIEDRYPPSFR